jgi:4-hydroxy-tetrahydrodipicolinate synthase
MYDRSKYGRVLVPIVTPFAADESIDHGRLAALANYLVDRNLADSLILTGSNGEFFSETFAERVAIFATLKEAVGARIPLIPHVGCVSTRETIELAREAVGFGFDAAMIVTPYYTRPTAPELYAHYAAVAEAVPALDIIIYNIPTFAGVNVDPETMGRLAHKYPNIVAMKEEAEHNPKQITRFIAATPDDFVIYNGNNTMILEAYSQGGVERIGGVVSGASHLVGDYVRKLIETFLAGKISEAARMQQKLYPLIKALVQGGRCNPAPLQKDALRLLGVDAGIPRRPLLAANAEELANIRQAMVDFGLL